PPSRGAVRGVLVLAALAAARRGRRAPGSLAGGLVFGPVPVALAMTVPATAPAVGAVTSLPLASRTVAVPAQVHRDHGKQEDEQQDRGGAHREPPCVV